MREERAFRVQWALCNANPDATWNEDAWGATETSAWVLDGATPLAPYEGESPAKRFAHAMSSGLSAAQGGVTQLLTAAMRACPTDLDHATASVGILALNSSEGLVEFAGLGDVTIVRRRNGLFERMRGGSSDLERRLVEEARGDPQLLTELLLRRRSVANSPDGYSILEVGNPPR